MACHVTACCWTSIGNRYEEALGDFTNALAVAPESALALCNRGTCRMKMGNLEAALLDFDAALRVDGDNVDCLMTRGSVNRKVGCLVEAIQDYSRVL